VKRSPTAGGAYSVIATNVAGLAFTNAGLANGTLYYFTVSATNSASESANCNEVSARPTSATSPQITMASSSGQMTLGWPADHTGWLVQGQTNAPDSGLTTNWVTVPGSDSTNQLTLPADPANGSVFFRLSHP